jgi:hypothetical protein
MRTDLRPLLLSGLRIFPCLLALSLGCQTYDFEPVPPVSLGSTTTTVSITPTALKPNLMLVLDRSGSMALPFDPTPPACGNCGQNGQPACNPATCPSRWDTVESTMSTFLSTNATVARMGVAFYPQLTGATINDPTSGNASNFCSVTTTVDVPIVDSDDDAQLQSSAQAVDFAIRKVGSTSSPLAGGVGGGTPTGDSLVVISQRAGFGSLASRQSYLLLMTDGLPNCNPNSGLDANVNPAACDCTDGPTSSACTFYPTLDCNDFNEVAHKVSNIRATGVKTIVIGYGDVFGPSAQNSLQQIALAGDFQRRCQADGSECNPSDTACFQESNPHVCAEQFFRVTSQAQLAAALAAVTSAIPQTDPCLVKLTPAPPDASFLSVVVTEQGVTTTYPYPSAIWTFATLPTGEATLTFNDPLCTKMRTASEDITYVVRAVQQL